MSQSKYEPVFNTMGCLLAPVILFAAAYGLWSMSKDDWLTVVDILTVPLKLMR